MSPWRPWGSFVFLCHAPCMTLLGKWPTMPCLRGSAEEPSSLDSSRHVFLRPGLGWRRWPGRSQGAGRSVGVDWEPQGSGEPLSPKRRSRHSQAQQGFFSRGCVQAYPMGIAPEHLGDPRGVGQGSSLARNHWTRGLTYPHVRISSLT